MTEISPNSVYRPEICQQMIEFFSRDHTRANYEIGITKGVKIRKRKTIPNDFPFFSAFAREIGVPRSTLSGWRKIHKEFGIAADTCEGIRREMLINNALKGYYNPAFSIFYAKNKFGWKDSRELAVTEGMPALLNAINKQDQPLVRRHNTGTGKKAIATIAGEQDSDFESAE